jgi:tetratricopeptide (TPR) repeat protein
LDINQFQWSYYQANLYLNTGRPLEALELFQQIEDIHPQPALLRIRIGEAYHALNRLAEARQSYLQAFYLRPEAPAILARIGELAVEEKQYRSAISFLGAALARQPDANRLHYPLAMAYRGLGDTEQAITHLNLRGSVGIQPYDPWMGDLENLLQGERSYLLRGKLAYSAARYEESVEAFRTALSFNKDSARAHINLGTALMQTGDTQGAIDHYLSALALEPDNLTVHYNLGFLYLDTGKYEDAITHLEKVIAVSSEDTSAYQLLAQALERSQRIEDAMEYYRMTVLIDPTAESAWLGGVRLLLLNGEYTKALNVLNQAYEKLPNSGLIVHALAKLLAASPDLSIRDGQRALPLAQSVFQADPSSGHARTVAMAYAETGECKEAVKWQKRAIDEYDNDNRTTKNSLKDELKYYKVNDPCRFEANSEDSDETGS